MIVSTPYIECYVKKSFLDGTYDVTKQETIEAVLIGIRFVRAQAPLFICYLPSIGAVYDKVDQCAIFNIPNPTANLTNPDVGWWDSISDNWQLLQIEFLKTLDIVGYMNGSVLKMEGNYLFTCEPLPEPTEYGQAKIWHEHKTKTFAFDYETGVLFCVPNNKMRVLDQSLTHNPPEDPSWLKVYKPKDVTGRTHENKGFFGKATSFDYSDH